jgi:hypothetical protein
MDKKLICAIVAGVILYAVGIALRFFSGEGGLQFVLSFATPFIVGVIVTGVRRGFLAGFILSVPYAVVSNSVLSPETYGAIGEDVSVAFALIALVLAYAVIAGALGALGGLLGKKIFEEKAWMRLFGARACELHSMATSST